MFSLSAGLPLGPIRVLCYTVGPDLYFNSAQKVHTYKLVMCYRMVMETEKHYSGQRY